MSEVIELLPKDRVVLEILEHVRITDPLVQRCKALKSMGFTLALDDFTGRENEYRPLLEVVDIVKVDIQGMDQPHACAHDYGSQAAQGQVAGGEGRHACTSGSVHQPGLRIVPGLLLCQTVRNHRQTFDRCGDRPGAVAAGDIERMTMQMAWMLSSATTRSLRRACRDWRAKWRLAIPSPGRLCDARGVGCRCSSTC